MTQVRSIARDNLAGKVYTELRAALMEGRFWPGERLKVRDLARLLGVSETPTREAIMQLVRERGLEMQAAKAITVAELSLGQYIELRTIRLALEGMAAEAAAGRIGRAAIRSLAATHEKLVAAEEAGRWREAVRRNWQFHHTLYAAAAMPELLAIIESIWLRNGPLVNYLYPHARPTYPGEHRHLSILAALEARDPAAVRMAVQNDMIEGGTGLVALLERLERGEIDKDALRQAADGEAVPPPDRFQIMRDTVARP